MSWIITGTEKNPVDPYFGNVSLLLHGDGTNGSTTIIDSSPSPKTVTAEGNAQISTSIAEPFGTSNGILTFDGSGDRLVVPSSSDLGFGTGDFTIEYWFWAAALETTSIHFDMRIASTGESAPEIYSSSTTLYYYSQSANKITATSAFVAQVWTHVALSRASNQTRLFVNGSQVGLTYSDSTDYSATRPITIGSVYNNAGIANFNGYMDDFRITKGVARYTSNFTPPTAPFPDF